jgi:peptide/nickel transport system substrate-binding protein
MSGSVFQSRKLVGLIAAGILAMSGSAAFAQEKVLRVAPQADLRILDPIWTTAIVTRNHAFMIYDTLFGMDAQGKILPQMVDTWKTSADGLVWDFKLRPGLAFHDKTPVTSADVIQSIKRWGSRDTLGVAMMERMSKMEAIDANNFRLTFSKPFGMVLDAFAKASPPFIMPERIAKTPGDQQISENIGSGPFMFKQDEYRPGNRIVYLKNKDYVSRAEPPQGTAGGKPVPVDRVDWVVLKDAQTQANALANGEIDMIERMPPEQYSAFKANANIELISQMPQGSTMLVMNHLVPPFNNDKIARAATLAISQEALLRAQMVNNDLFKSCASIYPCGTIYASTTRTSGFTGKPQFAAAKKLLEEAGYDGKPIVIMHPTDHSTLNKYPPVMAALLKQAGFNVEVQSMDWQTLVTRRAKKDPSDKGGWNIFMTGFFLADTINPLVFSPITGNGEKGWFGWPTNAKVEALKGQFLETIDETKRKELAAQIQEEVYASGMFAPLGEYKPLVAVRKGVTGVLQSPNTVMWNIDKK